MTLLSLWNRFSFGALLLSILTVMLFWFSERSYWLMRLFFAIAVPVTTSLILLSLMVVVTLVLAALLEFRWRMRTTWRMILWVSVFVFSCLGFLGGLWTRYEITATAALNNQSYYLIKFLHIDASYYKLYCCEPLGLFCTRSSDNIRVPFQNAPISLQYNPATQKVYMQNADQVIQIPDQ